MVIRLIFPNFGTSIIRSTCLSIQKAFLSYFGNIHITKLGGSIFVEEYISALKISVEDIDVVERLKASNDLNKYPPNFIFMDIMLLLLMRSNLLE